MIDFGFNIMYNDDIGSLISSKNYTPFVIPTTVVTVPVSETFSEIKQVSFMSGTITANSKYNFDITPGDKNLPTWMQSHVGTDWLLGQFKEANLNSVVLHFNYALDKTTDIVSRPSFDSFSTPTWETIESGAIRAENAGLKPIFYMTVVQLPYSWDSLLASKYVPNNPDAFFASYKEQIMRIAALSEKYDSPYMAIGVELGPVATDKKYLSYWEDIIFSVRQVYDGKLAYTSYVNDINNYHTELTRLTFTNMIDMLGMNIYPQTLDHGELTGTYEQFYAEWKTSIVPNLQSLVEKLDKPVFISELGINRLDGTGSKSYWNNDAGLPVDYSEQAELYDAALRAIHEGLDVEGIVFWGAADNTKLVNRTIDLRTSYTTNWVEVPAEAVIQKWSEIFLPDVPVFNWYDSVGSII